MKKLLIFILVCFTAAGLAAQQVEIYPQVGPQDTSITSFSPDGRWILSGGRIWEAASLRELKHPYSGSIIEWSPDMRLYLTGISSTTISVREWETDNVVFRLQNISSTGLASRTKNIIFSPDGRQIAAITSDNRNIKIWDAANGQELITITTDSESSIYSFCYSEDGRTIAFRDSASGVGAVKVFDLVNNRQLRSFPVVGTISPENRFSHDGKRYFTCNNTQIIIYNTETGRELRTITTQNYSVTTMVWRPDGRQLVSVDRNNVMKVWDAETGRELRSTQLEHDFYSNIAFSPDGRRLALRPRNRLIVLDAENYREVAAINSLETIRGSSYINVNFLNEKQTIFETYENIHLWDIETGRKVWSVSKFISEFDAYFVNAYFSPDNRFFAKAEPPTNISQGGSNISIYDTATGSRLRTWPNMRAGNSIADYIIWSANGREIITIYSNRNGSMFRFDLWNVENGQRISSFDHEIRLLSGSTTNSISSILSPDSTRIAYRLSDSLQVYETRGTRRLLTINGSFNRAQWSPDGRRILTTSENGAIRIWDAQTGREVQGAPRHERLWQIEYSPDGRQIATSGEDGFIRAWNTTNNSQLWEYNVQATRLERLYYNTDGTRIIAVTNFSREVRILDSATGQLLFSRNERIASISPDGKRIITVAQDGRLRLWDAETLIEKAQFIAYDGGEWLSMTPDGYYAASARGDQYLNASLGNTVTGIDRYRSTFNRPDILAARLSNTGRMTHNESVVSVSVNPAGTRIASVSHDKSIKIWDLESGRLLRTIANIGGYVNAISWSPDGSRLVHGAEDNTVRIWNAETGAAIRTISGHTDYVNEARYSPDGRFIASCADDKLIKIWDAETGREIRTLRGHTDSVGISVITWSPDGRRLASGSVEEERTIRIWDVESGRLLQSIPNQGGRIWGLAFSPDGRRIASCTPNEPEVKIWDAENGRLIRSIPIEDSEPYSLAWSPDGRQLAVGSTDGTGYIDFIDTDTAEIIHYIWARGVPQSVTWTPDGRRIVASSNFSDIQMIKVFDALNGNELY